MYMRAWHAGWATAVRVTATDRQTDRERDGQKDRETERVE